MRAGVIFHFPHWQSFAYFLNLLLSRACIQLLGAQMTRFLSVTKYWKDHFIDLELKISCSCNWKPSNMSLLQYLRDQISNDEVINVMGPICLGPPKSIRKMLDRNIKECWIDCRGLYRVETECRVPASHSKNTRIISGQLRRNFATFFYSFCFGLEKRRDAN